MPKLNLSILSDPMHLKQISRREFEIIERINKLKQDDGTGRSSVVGAADQANPNLMKQLHGSTVTISRNMSQSIHGIVNQNASAPQVVPL